MVCATILATTSMLSSRNGRGFLLPLIRNLSNLEKLGIKLNISYSMKNAKEVKSDIIILLGRALLTDYKTNYNKLIRMLKLLKRNTDKLIFFDTNDDSGTNRFFKLLPYVDKYCKAYVYKDRSFYKREFYGGRIWSDYYHKAFGINDELEYINHPITNEEDLKKIQVGYLLGLADNSSSLTIKTNGRYLNLLRKIGLIESSQRKRSPIIFSPPSLSRERDISCRISTNYSKKRETITYHRKMAAEILGEHISVDKISRKQYLKELLESKIVISPFGWGELNTPRDYEVAMSGSILIKPDIGHLETFPDIFNDNTVVQYKWDYSDLIERINEVLENYDQYLIYAKRLQERYKYYMCSEGGNLEFCNHISNILLD